MITDKLSKVSYGFTINRYDNGFMVEATGRDDDDNWKTARVLCNTEEDLITVIRQINKLPLEE